MNDYGQVSKSEEPRSPLRLFASPEDECDTSIRSDIQFDLGTDKTNDEQGGRLESGVDRTDDDLKGRSRSNSAPVSHSWEMAMHFDDEEEEDTSLSCKLLDDYDGDVEEVATTNDGTVPTASEADEHEGGSDEDRATESEAEHLLVPKRKNLRTAYTRYSYRTTTGTGML